MGFFSLNAKSLHLLMNGCHHFYFHSWQNCCSKPPWFHFLFLFLFNTLREQSRVLLIHSLTHSLNQSMFAYCPHFCVILFMGAYFEMCSPLQMPNTGRQTRRMNKCFRHRFSCFLVCVCVQSMSLQNFAGDWVILMNSEIWFQMCLFMYSVDIIFTIVKYINVARLRFHSAAYDLSLKCTARLSDFGDHFYNQILHMISHSYTPSLDYDHVRIPTSNLIYIDIKQKTKNKNAVCISKQMFISISPLSLCKTLCVCVSIFFIAIDKSNLNCDTFGFIFQVNKPKALPEQRINIA